MIKHPRRVEEEILTVLSDWSPLSAKAYAELAGIKYNAAFDRLTRMHDAGLIHIDHFERRKSGKHRPHYAIGKHPDAPPLATYTEEEKRRRYRESDKGKATYAKAARKRNKRAKTGRKTDLAWAERQRAYNREYMRKRHGHKPRRALVAVEKFDPLLAAMMGLTKKRSRRKGGDHA